MLMTVVIRELDAVEKTIQRATRRSKDGKIDVTDFLDEAATARNSVFTPLEASIIFHMASRGAASTTQRLSIADFDALLDAKVSHGKRSDP
jgi:solute carrier family 25 aspartate/glutamate transporter 12/13